MSFTASTSNNQSNRNSKRKSLSIKQLESHLQDLDEFEEPKVELEQYATPPHIAAVMLNTIDLTYDDIQDRLVADLGCGTGRLAIGCLLSGAAMVYGFDVDAKALNIGLENIYGLFGEEEDDDDESKAAAYTSCGQFNFIQTDIASSKCDRFWQSFENNFETVVMNPPFGTKQTPGLDMMFLKRAIDISSNVVYSLHKTSTRGHILNRCQQWVVKAKPIAQIKYNLENSYKFHRKKSVDIDVDLWRIIVPKVS